MKEGRWREGGKGKGGKVERGREGGERGREEGGREGRWREGGKGEGGGWKGGGRDGWWVGESVLLKHTWPALCPYCSPQSIPLSP